VFQPHSWDSSGDLYTTILPLGQTLEDAHHQRQDIQNLRNEKLSVIEGIVAPALAMKNLEFHKLSPTDHSPFQYQDQTLLTPHYKVRFDESGFLTELIDLKTSRRLDQGNSPLNTLMIGEDLPALWDNWDIDEDQHLKLKVVDELLEQNISEGPLQFRIRNTYKLGLASTLWQDVIFHKNSSRIDFETKVDWQEPHNHLKTCFDLNIHTKELKSETQYGWFSRSMHSNTSYDKAKFEFSQHRWSHLGEPNYGIAIFNDSNYGLAHLGTELRLSLLKSGGHPDPSGDAGVHYLNYALYPHSGPFNDQVIREAHQFNQGTLAFQQHQPEHDALVSCPHDNVIIDTIKTSECGHDLIIRLYEAEGSSVQTQLRCAVDIKSAQLCNMLEEQVSSLPLEEQKVDLSFNAFEVKTIRCGLS
jgi:alpha-mannosidase